MADERARSRVALRAAIVLVLLVTVVSAAGTLPRTGRALGPVIQFGALAIVAGLALLFVRRRA